MKCVGNRMKWRGGHTRNPGPHRANRSPLGGFHRAFLCLLRSSPFPSSKLHDAEGDVVPASTRGERCHGARGVTQSAKKDRGGPMVGKGAGWKRGAGWSRQLDLAGTPKRQTESPNLEFQPKFGDAKKTKNPLKTSIYVHFLCLFKKVCCFAPIFCSNFIPVDPSLDAKKGVGWWTPLG